MASLSTGQVARSSVTREILLSVCSAPKRHTRRYAKRVSKFRGGNGERGDPNAVFQPRSSVGTFLPMPKSSLQHCLFEPDHPDELSMQMFTPNILTKDVVGHAMDLGVNKQDAFRIFGLPKNILLEFRLLSKPCTIIRDVTLSTVDMLDAASVKASQDTRVVLTGEQGTGKSFTLLQAVQYCMLRKWIVIYIPRGISLVNSSTQYVYDPRTRTYLQPVMANRLLQRCLTVNRSALSDLITQNDLELDQRPTVPAGTLLTDLIDVGLKDQNIAPTILTALLLELGEQTSHPVLLAVDDFQALYCKTSYRDPQFGRIKSYHLSVPHLLLEYASGKKSFTRGAVFGAISTTHNDFLTSLELREALDLRHPAPNSPYFKRSADMQMYAKGLQKLEVPPQLTVDEAAGVFEIWMKNRALHSASNDELFMSKYTEASGNPREFVWRGLLGTLETNVEHIVPKVKE